MNKYEVIVEDKTIYIVSANNIQQAKIKFEDGETDDERFIEYQIREINRLPKQHPTANQIAIQYIESKSPVNVRSVSVKSLNMREYVHNLLGNLLEAVVEMYELPDGNMGMEDGARMVQIGNELSSLLDRFINTKSKR